MGHIAAIPKDAYSISFKVQSQILFYKFMILLSSLQVTLMTQKKKLSTLSLSFYLSYICRRERLYDQKQPKKKKKKKKRRQNQRTNKIIQRVTKLRKKKKGEGARCPFDQEASRGTCIRCCKSLSLLCTKPIISSLVQEL